MDLPRPVFLKLSKIRWPIMALVSILHRVAGVILVMVTPVIIYFLSVSLDSAEGYQYVRNVLDLTFFKPFAVVTLWAFGHHIFAGVRLLLLESLGRPTSGYDSARWVLVLSGVGLLLAIFLVLI